LIIKLLSGHAKAPEMKTDGAAGYDLYAATSRPITLTPGETVMVPCGFSIELEENTAAFVLPRSGIASKRNLAPANTPGLIDSDYRGEVMVALRNKGAVQQTIVAGERIAQMVVIEVPYMPMEVIEYESEDELSATERDGGGFGSTGEE